VSDHPVCGASERFLVLPMSKFNKRVVSRFFRSRSIAIAPRATESMCRMCRMWFALQSLEPRQRGSLKAPNDFHW
jgi:hypothetical protein